MGQPSYISPFIQSTEVCERLLEMYGGFPVVGVASSYGVSAHLFCDNLIIFRCGLILGTFFKILFLIVTSEPEVNEMSSELSVR